MNENGNLERFVPLHKIAETYGISVASLKQTLHIANRKGVPLPSRRLFKRKYLYDRIAFSDWLWANAATLKSHFSDAIKSRAIGDENDVQ